MALDCLIVNTNPFGFILSFFKRICFAYCFAYCVYLFSYSFVSADLHIFPDYDLPAYLKFPSKFLPPPFRSEYAGDINAYLL